MKIEIPEVLERVGCCAVRLLRREFPFARFMLFGDHLLAIYAFQVERNVYSCMLLCYLAFRFARKTPVHFLMQDYYSSWEFRMRFDWLFPFGVILFYLSRRNHFCKLRTRPYCNSCRNYLLTFPGWILLSTALFVWFFFVPISTCQEFDAVHFRCDCGTLCHFAENFYWGVCRDVIC